MHMFKINCPFVSPAIDRVRLVLQPYSISFSHHSSSSLQLQPANSVFLSHYSSSSLQLQPAERSDCEVCVLLSMVMQHWVLPPRQRNR